MDKQLKKEFINFFQEKELGNPKVIKTLNFILKNWNAEKECFSEWYEKQLKIYTKNNKNI